MVVETETLELKKSLLELKEGIISLSAMLNKAHNGNVIFGINDEGEIKGVTIGTKTKADITHEIQNELKPLPNTVNISEENIDGKSIIKVSVSGNDTPYAAYGRYYIRINDADIVMSASQLEKFFEEKQDNYLKWEQKETKYGFDDIDEDLLIDCIRTVNERGRLNYIYRNPKEALNKLNLLTENDNLNNAGWYLFGKNKPLTIKLATYPTDSKTNLGEIKEFSGNIIECINESISYIQSHITYKSKIVGIQRIDIPEIPLEAIREIVINSYAHASYANVGDFNQYIIYRSSVMIYNPGTIIKGIDPIKFASGEVGSKLRNLLIASTLFKYCYIEAFGTGFDKAFTSCIDNDVNYHYKENGFGFTFIFERNINFLSENNTNIIIKINNIDESIIREIKENKYITIPELSIKVGKSEPTIHRHLDFLAKNNYIKRIGSRKNGYWKLCYNNLFIL